MWQINNFEDWQKYLKIDHSSFTNLVRKFDWQRGIPGGWLDYSPSRKVIAYGDGSKYTIEGHGYDKLYNYTAWKASVPASYCTAVTKTAPLPKKFIQTGIMKAIRNLLNKNGIIVNDYSCTGMWCNYYSEPGDYISAHTDNEDYYQRNLDNNTVFVSLTLYEDELFIDENLAKFQIYDQGSWKDIELPHMTLLIMSGDIEHRVKKTSSKFFRPRYNITFRTPVSREEDIVKNFRFFSNFGRYYRPTAILYVPKDIFDPEPNKNIVLSYKHSNNYAYDKNNKYKLLNIDKYRNTLKVLKEYSKINDLKLKINQELNRKELQEYFNISSTPSTTTNEALLVLKNNEF